MLKPEIKTLWVDALRSDKYKQGHGKIKDRNKLCVLGVLISLHCDAEGLDLAEELRGKSNASMVPVSVRRWSGLEQPSIMHELVNRNDIAKQTFKQLATIIEIREDI